MIETFYNRTWKILNWVITFKFIKTPTRKKKYPSHLTITITK